MGRGSSENFSGLPNKRRKRRIWEVLFSGFQRRGQRTGSLGFSAGRPLPGGIRREWGTHRLADLVHDCVLPGRILPSLFGFA
jgi:hypothetical protein